MKTRLSLLPLLALAPFAMAAESPSVAPAPVPVAAVPSSRVQSSARDLGVIEINTENDLFSLRENKDRYYTNGFKLAYVTAATNAPDSVWDHRYHYGAAQEMYTAANRFAAVPAANDHPYSAWLYAMVGSSWDDGESLDLLTLKAGIVGPGALGRQVQNTDHATLGLARLQGWGTQLRNEPGIDIEWRRSWRIALTGAHPGSGYAVDVVPMLNAEVGTVRDVFSTGAQLRFGKNLPADYGVNDQRHGAVGGAPVRAKGGSGVAPDAWYGFVDTVGELRLWDMALAGNIYHDSPEVRMRRGVMQFGGGVAAHWGATRLTLAQYVRSTEYRGQDGWFYFGGATLAVGF